MGVAHISIGRSPHPIENRRVIACDVAWKYVAAAEVAIIGQCRHGVGERFAQGKLALMPPQVNEIFSDRQTNRPWAVSIKQAPEPSLTCNHGFEIPLDIIDRQHTQLQAVQLNAVGNNEIGADEGAIIHLTTRDGLSDYVTES